jgi:hypothetical protein
MISSWRWPLAGFVVGSLLGATMLTVNAVGAFVGDREAVTPTVIFGEILHTPPALVPVGQPLQLAYELVCPPRADEPEHASCSPTGAVHIRAAGEAEFAEVPLVADDAGRLSATVPKRYTLGQGFDYYADIEDGRGGAGSLPASGREAPQHVWTLSADAIVDLGTHEFGGPRPPDAVVARAGWGRDDGRVGLISGREQAVIGPSAFDVGSDGSVAVLDQVNHRIVVFERGAPGRGFGIPFAGGEGDLVISDSGPIYVLDDGGAETATPSVRSFDGSGRLIASTPVAEPVADMLRMGPRGPLVHTYPSELWFPTGAWAPPISPGEQAGRGRPGREVEDGLEVVVHAGPDAARSALVRGEDVVQSWLVKSATKLGEVQLAEPYRDGLLVVLRVWTENEAEFQVLRLVPGGLGEGFSVERAEWAESASLSRFRLHGDTLYQLRSSPGGIEIATYEIGGER